MCRFGRSPVSEIVEGDDLFEDRYCGGKKGRKADIDDIEKGKGGVGVWSI